MGSIKIYLDHYVDACYPGQTITGKIQCNFSEGTNLRAVRVKFKGRAETRWEESERYYDDFHKEHRTRHVTYTGGEAYFDAEYNLVQGGDNFQLPPGTHTYPFSYILPAQLPSSFEGSHGNIRYYIKATVDRPWKFDYEDMFPLNLVSPLDLNYLPGVRDPVATSVDKTMCSCWCNDSGALTFNMSLPASGFVPGQDVDIGGYIQNMTNVSAENVKFKIVGDIEFIAHFPSTKRRYDDMTIAGCMESGVGAHGEKSWTSTLKIPPHPFPNLIPCSIINLTYALRAKVIIPWPHTNLESEVPVAIGTVPLAGVSTTFSAGPPPEMPFPVPSGPLTEGSPLIPNMPTGHPSGNAPPYPPGGNAPYPPGGSAPYPPGGSAPYPPGGSAPYPPGGSAPYPPGGSVPYPSAGQNVPYPFEDTKLPLTNPGGFMDSKNPSAPPEGTQAGGTPYPPSSAPYPSSAPPSYEEAKNLKEKN